MPLHDTLQPGVTTLLVNPQGSSFHITGVERERINATYLDRITLSGRFMTCDWKLAQVDQDIELSALESAGYKVVPAQNMPLFEQYLFKGLPLPTHTEFQDLISPTSRDYGGVYHLLWREKQLPDTWNETYSLAYFSDKDAGPASALKQMKVTYKGKGYSLHGITLFALLTGATMKPAPAMPDNLEKAEAVVRKRGARYCEGDQFQRWGATFVVEEVRIDTDTGGNTCRAYRGSILEEGQPVREVTLSEETLVDNYKLLSAKKKPTKRAKFEETAIGQVWRKNTTGFKARIVARNADSMELEMESLTGRGSEVLRYVTSFSNFLINYTYLPGGEMPLTVPPPASVFKEALEAESDASKEFGVRLRSAAQIIAEKQYQQELADLEHRTEQAVKLISIREQERSMAVDRIMNFQNYKERDLLV